MKTVFLFLVSLIIFSPAKGQSGSNERCLYAIEAAQVVSNLMTVYKMKSSYEPSRDLYKDFIIDWSDAVDFLHGELKKRGCKKLRLPSNFMESCARFKFLACQKPSDTVYTTQVDLVAWISNFARREDDTAEEGQKK
jgi:hypothetical protein